MMRKSAPNLTLVPSGDGPSAFAGDETKIAQRNSAAISD